MTVSTVLTIPWISGTQRSQLAEALFGAFPDWPSLNRLIQYGLDVRPNAVVSTSGNVRDAIDQLIAWSESKSQLGQLIQAARAENATNDLLIAVAADIGSASFGIGGLQTPLIRGNNPVLDRESLREFVTNMSAGNGGSVLAIAGSPGSGKSYSASVISHVVNQDRIRIASIDLADFAGGLSIGDLTEVIATQLGRAEAIGTIPPCPPNDQIARWVLKLSGWIVGEVRALIAKTTIKTVWIILDGFGAVRRQEIDVSFQDLALHLVATAQSIPEMAIILIDYPDAIPKIENLIYRDEIRPPTTDDVRRVFEGVVRQTGRQMSPDLLQQLVDATWNEALPSDPKDREWLRRLGRAVKTRVHLLLART